MLDACMHMLSDFSKIIIIIIFRQDFVAAVYDDTPLYCVCRQAYDKETRHL